MEQHLLDFEKNLPKTELPNDLINDGIRVIEVDAPKFGKRKIFINLKPEHTQFVQGQRVLPAEFVGIPDQGAVYFKKTYEPGSKFFSDGGHQCVTEFGGIRTFYLDALMIHPSAMKKGWQVEVEGLKKRGRKADPNKVKKDPDAPKGKRGRKPLDPTLKAQIEAEKLANREKRIAENGGEPLKRGRPKMDPSLKKPVVVKDSNAPKGKRGRPSVPEHLRKSKPYIPSGKPRGRPKKNISNESNS